MRFCLELGYLPCLSRLCRLDRSITIRLRLSDDSVALHLGGPRLAQGVQVPVTVTDVLQGERDYFQPHVGEVGNGHLLDRGSELVAVLVNVFGRHGTDDRPKVALDGLEGDFFDQFGALSEKLLRGRSDRLLVTSNLHLSDGIDDNRDAGLGVNLGSRDVERHNLEAEQVDFFQQRDNEGAAAAPDPESYFFNTAVRCLYLVLPAGNDHYLVGTHFLVAPGYGIDCQDECHCQAHEDKRHIQFAKHVDSALDSYALQLRTLKIWSSAFSLHGVRAG